MKTIADLCIWLSKVIYQNNDAEINWREIKKYIDDFAADNQLKLELKKQ